MSHGPGKYDDLATIVRERSNARAVMVIVLGGNKGAGFSVQCEDPAVLAFLPDLLDQISADIRADIKKPPPGGGG